MAAETPFRVARISLFVAFGGALLAGAIGLALSFVHVPDTAAAWDGIDPGAGGSALPDALHLAGGVVRLVTLAAATGAVVAVAVVFRRHRPSGVRLAAAVGGLGIATGAALVTLATGPLVAWDQLALRSLSTGGGLDGYWTAAFDPAVRFVLVDGIEVQPADYAVVAVLHVVAPLFAALGVVWGWWSLRERRPTT